MKLQSVHVTNFRLLKDVDVSLEEKTTLIVGRNNSGKTSLTELFRRLFAGTSPSFHLEDFPLPVYEDFWSAFILHTQGSNDEDVRKATPSIEAALTFGYSMDTSNLGPLAELIIDLDSETTTAQAIVKYELPTGKASDIFKDIEYTAEGDQEQQKRLFFRTIQERIPKLYSTVVFAIDPTDGSNQKELELSDLRSILLPGFISAQRRLDDFTVKDRDVLGRVLEKMLSTAKSEAATPEDRTTAQELEDAVKGIQEKMDTDFNYKLNKLLPTLELFGYPGLNGPQLQTETFLDVERLLENHTRLSYVGVNGIGLPEAYNGLGTRNLIYILFQLFEFFKTFQTMPIAPATHLIFIEEPEAHLHPQMQEVFTRKISEIAEAFSKELPGDKKWPVQFVVTTHSSHVANAAPFEAIRYFLRINHQGTQTKIKDLRLGLAGTGIHEDKEFLHKYLTLTRCDLFFADKAMLIEGPTERILMPKMMEIVDNDPANTKKLGTQYLTVVEVGGAYAHRFLNLINFLELRTLIITDIDTTKAVVSAAGKTTYQKCKVVEGTHTSNACIKAWFEDGVTPTLLAQKIEANKVKETIRIAYQICENEGEACGRSFEDAFMLANSALFDLQGGSDEEKADDAWERVEKIGKTNFALEFAIEKTNWIIPKYIKEGLLWLAESPLAADSEDEPAEQDITATEADNDSGVTSA
jgi:putative ATP-dependent endonuclease of OLD family